MRDEGTSHGHKKKARGGASTGSVGSAPQVTSLWVANETFNRGRLSEKGSPVPEAFGFSLTRA